MNETSAKVAVTKGAGSILTEPGNAPGDAKTPMGEPMVAVEDGGAKSKVLPALPWFPVEDAEDGDVICLVSGLETESPRVIGTFDRSEVDAVEHVCRCVNEVGQLNPFGFSELLAASRHYLAVRLGDMDESTEFDPEPYLMEVKRAVGRLQDAIGEVENGCDGVSIGSSRAAHEAAVRDRADKAARVLVMRNVDIDADDIQNLPGEIIQLHAFSPTGPRDPSEPPPAPPTPPADREAYLSTQDVKIERLVEVIGMMLGALSDADAFPVKYGEQTYSYDRIVAIAATHGRFPVSSPVEREKPKVDRNNIGFDDFIGKVCWALEMADQGDLVEPFMKDMRGLIRFTGPHPTEYEEMTGVASKYVEIER